MEQGQNRAIEAAKAALASPLLDAQVTGAKGVLFNITGGPSLTLFECNEAASVISEAVDPRANIIFGVVFDPKLDSEIKITVIATGFTSQYGKGSPDTEELRRLMKGGGDTLDVPSFLRRSQQRHAGWPGQSGAQGPERSDPSVFPPFLAVGPAPPRGMATGHPPSF